MRGSALIVIASALLTASCAQTSAPDPQAAAMRVVTPEEDVAHPGKAAYDKACAACHNNPEGTRAPGLASLRLMRKPSVEYAITIGYMRTQAKNLTGKLLLIVGELDRNVDPASTMQVVDALIRANKDFDFLLVPGSGHGAAGSPYAQRRQRDFFVRHLLGVEPRAK